MLEFWSPWCKWCKFIFNDFEELVEMYTLDKSSEHYRDDFVIARINGQDYQDIPINYRIIYYPSLVIFHPNDTKIKSMFDD